MSSSLSSDQLFQAAAPLPLLQEWPTDASGYELIGKIGQGAFAIVWKAGKISKSTAAKTTDTATETITTISQGQKQQDDAVGGGKQHIECYCAVKVLNLDHVDTNLSEIRLEVQAMRLLSHPNVLECFTAFVVDRNLWLVTPLMRKGSSLHCLQVARRTLYQQQLQQPLNSDNRCFTSMEPHVFYIIHETLLGLQYIHENGQIHRDIKAGNILLDDAGGVKIADFGVSGWLVQGGAREEKAKTFVGTPCWMAPEVMEQVNGYDYKADIWSLGITALELARGYAPYAKYPPMKVLILTIQDDPPSLDSYDTAEDMYEDCDSYGDRSIQYAAQESYSKLFEQFVATCLQKNPSKRPNCQELLNSKFFTQYTDNNARSDYPSSSFRQQRREAWMTQVCSLVPDVGAKHLNNLSSQQQHLVSRAMPGNSPISIILSSSSDDRPAGTTWVFADGSSSSQVLSSSSGSKVIIPSSPTDETDVFAELDEFGKLTGGENYSSTTTSNSNDQTLRTSTGLHKPPRQQPQQPQQEQNYHEHTVVQPVVSTLESVGLPVTQQQPSDKDDLDDFMNEFEQTVAGEDFRRQASLKEDGVSEDDYNRKDDAAR